MRSSSKRIAANTGWLMLGRIGTGGINLLLAAMLARGLGEAGFGRYAFITSIGFLGNVASTFGMDTFVIRSVARGERHVKTDITAALLIQLGISGLFIIGVWLFALLGTVSAEITAPLQLYILILIPLAAGTIYSAILRGAERMDAYLAYTLTTAVVQLVGIWFVLQRSDSLLAVCGVILLANFAGALVAGVLSRRIVPTAQFTRTFDPHALRAALNAGGILALIMIFTLLARQLGVYTLQALTDDATVGQFGAANKLADIGRILPSALFGALFPSMARAQHRSARFNQLFWSLFALFLLGAIVGQWLAAPLITLLFRDYANSVVPFQILLFSLPLVLLRLRLSFELVGENQERLALWATAIMLALSIPLFIWSIRQFGLLGAAWATNGSLILHVLLLWGAWKGYNQRNE